jgi:peroxiredoxin family protein
MAEHLGLVVQSGQFDRVQYALAIASAAAALDRPVTLFVTLGAARAFMVEDERGRRPAWAGLPLSPELVEPGISEGGALDARNRERGIAGFEELLAASASLGVELMVCEMGLRAVGLEMAALRTDLPLVPGGLATLLAKGGQLVVL